MNIIKKDFILGRIDIQEVTIYRQKPLHKIIPMRDL